MHPHVNICKNQLRLTLFYVFVHFVQIEISIIWWQALSSSAGLHFLQIDIALERDRKSFHILDFLHFFGTHISHGGLEQAYSEKSINLAGIQYSLWHFCPFQISIMYHIILKQFWMKSFQFAQKNQCSVWYQNCNVNTVPQLRIRWIILFFLFLLIHWP